MARKITRKSLKHDEFVETAFDIGEWLKVHWKNVAIGGGAVLGIALIVGGWYLWTGSRQAQAKRELAEGLHLYGAMTDDATGLPGATTPDPARYTQALAAFERAAGLGGGSPVGRTADFYRGATLLRLGRAAEAAETLEKLLNSGAPPVLNDTARALLAQAYESAGNDEKAVALLRDLSQGPSGTFPQDMALLHLGKILQKQGKSEEARQAWQDILARFPQGGAVGEARILLGGEAPNR